MKALGFLVLMMAASVAQANGKLAAPVKSPETLKAYEQNAIKKDRQVLAFSKALGARSFKLIPHKSPTPLYTVQTGNGCSFDVEVIYNDAYRIEAIVVYQAAVCN